MATTPNYSFSVYSSTDTDVRFLDFRVATAGSQSTSNFYVIDTVLKQHSDAIDSINATPSAFVVKGTYSSGSLYTASVANYPGYKNEQLIVLSLNQKNTGAVQININGTTNKDVMKYGSDGVLKAVDAGDFVANSPVLCLYDGTRFVVIGITSASSITVTGEAGDILQIADDGTIESSGKKAAQPNGIATLDENGNVVQVANMANSAAAVYSGEPVTIEYAGAQRIASITAYGENAQGGTTEAPVALTGVDSAILFEQHTPINLAKPIPGDFYGVSVITNADGSVTVKGTATNETWPRLVRVDIPSAIIAGYITISLSSPASVRVSFEAIKPDGRKESYTLSAGSTSMTVKIKSGYTRLHCFLSLLPDQTIDETFHIMIAQGTEPVPFVPYVEPSITHLPIPRPLHKVGDVRDVCQTRVKSVYDKRIVLSSADGFSFSSNAGNGYARFYKDYNSAKLSPIASDWLPGYAKTAYNATNEGVYSADSDAGTISIVLSIQRLIAAGATSGDTSTYLSAASAIFSAHPLTVYYQSTAYDGTNGLDVCLTEYQTGFVELDGTEKNLIDWESILTQFSTHAEVTKSISGNTITLSGTPTDVYRQIQVSNILISPSIRGKSATLSANISGNQPALVLRQYNESNVKITETTMTGTRAVQITISPDTAYLQIILCLNRQTTGTAFMASYGDVQLELGDVTFHDYGNGKGLFLDLSRSAFGQYSLEFSHGEVGGMPTITGGLAASFNASNLYRLQIIGIPDTWTALGVTDVATAKTWLAAQKAAGTPVQVVYQLATPEVYATDPVDFDNTAGPLTVVTGGQVEVKMTDFVTDRTPAFLNKLDKTGDGSDVTVTFTEAATDTDIASGDKLSILFGKILKRFTNILNGTTKVGYATKADTDNLGNQITETYANSLDVADNTIVLKNKIGENLSTITVPYANSAGNVATSIKEMGIAVQTASPYAWFLNYTGSGNKDGARKYYASVYADNATYSTSAGSSNNIVIYNNNWSGTDGSISAIYANAEKTYVNLSSSNAAGTAWPNISVQRINGHALNMALNGTSLSITW